MHDSSYTLAAVVLSLYAGRPGQRVLEIGALNVPAGKGGLCGSFRDFLPEGVSLVGVDRKAGPGVDVVSEGSELPFGRDAHDLVVSTSSFEHDEWFWVTFTEMARVCRPGGVVYVNAPAKGPYHGYPGDCWRFYPDAGEALASWARRQGEELRLLEHFLANAPGSEQPWIDNVMVFGKGPGGVWPSLKDEARRRGLASVGG